MKPLENRIWFSLMSMALSAILIFGLWQVSGLLLNLSASSIFLFATLGLWQAVNKLFALFLIKLFPSLGVVT